jgi:hypothetical protein
VVDGAGASVGVDAGVGVDADVGVEVDVDVGAEVDVDVGAEVDIDVGAEVGVLADGESAFGAPVAQPEVSTTSATATAGARKIDRPRFPLIFR